MEKNPIKVPSYLIRNFFSFVKLYFPKNILGSLDITSSNNINGVRKIFIALAFKSNNGYEFLFYIVKS
jgi:hypothetical protein